MCTHQLALKIDVVTLTCLGGFWGQVTGVALGVLVQPEKTAELLNTWSSILIHTAGIDITKSVSVWDSPVVSAQTIVVNTGQILFPVMYPLIGLIPSVPILALHCLRNAGILAENTKFYLVWWPVLYPLEVTILSNGWQSHF